MSRDGRSTVYVGGLSTSTREDDLRDLFAKYGRLRRIDIKSGYAFVEYDDSRDADDAVRGTDGREVQGKRISAEIARGGPRRPGDRPTGGRRTDYRVRVEGLDARTSWQDLKDFARTAGSVAFTDVFNDRGKKVGVIEYETRDGMDEAMRKLDDSKLDGVHVRLVKEGGGGGGGRGRSRSRSPRRRSSRSRSRGRDRSRSRGRERKERSPERKEKPAENGGRRSPSPAKDKDKSGDSKPVGEPVKQD